MADFQFLYPGISYTPTASSEDSDHPATNLKLYNNIHKDFRTETVDEVNLVLNLGALKSNVKVALDACNFSAISLQAHATDSWASPTVDDSITMAPKRWVQPHPLETGIQHRYGYFWEPTGFTNLQYVRLVIAAQTPTDSADHFRIGRLAVMGSDRYWELVKSPSLDFTQEADSPTGEIAYPNGSRFYSLGDDRAWVGSFQFNPFVNTTESLQQLQYLNAIPKDRVVVLYCDITGDREDFWFCYRKAAYRLTHGEGYLAQVDRVDFVEALV